MTFRISKPVIALLLLGTVTPPASHAFQNGNTPQKPPPTPTTTTTKSATATPKVVPGKVQTPFKWPIIGTLPDFLNRGGVDSLAEIYEGLYKDFGPVCGQSIMGDDEFVYSDPRVMDQILKQEGKFPVGGAEQVENFKEFYRQNDMQYALDSVSRGPEWKDWRRTVNADMFVLWGTYLPAIAETCSKISKVAGREVTETKNIHISDFLSRSAFDMFCSVLYGESFDTTDSTKATEEDIEFVRATKRAFDITGNLITNPMNKLLGSDDYKDFFTEMELTQNLASQRGFDSIDAAKATMARHEAATADESDTDSSSSSSSSSSGCPITAIQNSLTGKTKNDNNDIPTDFVNPSFVERLVNRGAVSKDAIAELQSPLLMAGVDTTAYALSWFFLNMASNPDVQAKLARELSETLQGADVTTVEQFNSLAYLKACFRESHRLSPTAPLYTKKLDKDVTLEIEGKSYPIPAGQKMSLNLRGYPMDPKIVEEPRAFRPERFSPEAVAARVGTTAELALDSPHMAEPFGRGKRQCLGANIARAEMQVLAARLLQDWEVSLADPKDAIGSHTKSWSPKQKLMLIADPYPDMVLTPRQPEA